MNRCRNDPAADIKTGQIDVMAFKKRISNTGFSSEKTFKSAEKRIGNHISK